MKDNSFFEISDIITAYIKGEISLEQKERLNKWILASNENRDLFESLLSDEKFDKALKDYEVYDVESAYMKVKSRKVFRQSRISLRRVLYYAAALAVPIIVAVVLFNKKVTKDNTIESFASGQITIGESKAQLILSNGEKIYLGKSVIDTISDDNINIISDGGVIEYKAGTEIIENKHNTLVVPKGGEFDIVLPDGTRVWLNSDSEMKYPLNFSGKIRKVYLKGEAYFKVAHNKKKPFIVETDGVNVKVLGTEFNVRSYYDEAKLATTLVNGSVEIESTRGVRNKLTLNPGYQAVLEKTTGNLMAEKVNVGDYIAWKTGRFVFKHKRLEDVMLELSRWYNVEVFYQNNSVKERTVTGILKRYDSFDEFIKMMDMTEVADFNVRGRTIIIKEK